MRVRLPRRPRGVVSPLALVALLAAAWWLAGLVPPRPPDPYARVAGELRADAPTAEVCAAAQVMFGVRLTAEDVAAWKALVAQGRPPARALRTVVDYRRALGGSR